MKLYLHFCLRTVAEKGQLYLGVLGRGFSQAELYFTFADYAMNLMAVTDSQQIRQTRPSSSLLFQFHAYPL